MSQTIKIHNFKTPFGEIVLGDFKENLVLCDWKYRKARTTIDQRIQTYLNASFIEETSPLLEETKEQLLLYFSGKLKEFDIPLQLIGTAFQKEVWSHLLKIPYGKTQSYLELSKSMNNEKAIRAVAAANGANAISIIVPCHRIIGADGSLTGYAGGLDSKKKLLQLEGAITNNQLRLF